MASKRHTIVEARSAKQRVETQLRGVAGVSLGIGQAENGSDFAVIVLVEDETTAQALPDISSELPVRIKVAGKAFSH